MRRGVLRVAEGGRVCFWCPGCQEIHVIRVAPAPEPWGFDGNYDRPTFSPSVLVTGRDFTPSGEAAFEAWHAAGCPKPAPQFESAATRCHSFVKAGRIQFLADCTHKLAGQTVDMTLPEGVCEP